MPAALNNQVIPNAGLLAQGCLPSECGTFVRQPRPKTVEMDIFRSDSTHHIRFFGFSGLGSGGAPLCARVRA